MCFRTSFVKNLSQFIVRIILMLEFKLECNV